LFALKFGFTGKRTRGTVVFAAALDYSNRFRLAMVSPWFDRAADCMQACIGVWWRLGLLRTQSYIADEGG
jgi:hypothetical protein